MIDEGPVTRFVTYLRGPTPIRAQSEEQITARARAKAFMQECAARERASAWVAHAAPMAWPWGPPALGKSL